MFEIFILSLIQGISEFIPVSSSSHLILFSNYIDFENQGLSIDVSLHIGSFLAVIVFFNKEILSFLKNRDLFYKIILSSIPIMILGLVLVKTSLIDKLRSIEVIGWATFIFGIVLYISDKFEFKNNLKKILVIKLHL